jgi:hypothetical protein
MPYPDWVLKHKQPGMYVQKKDDHTYRIYRGHSERRPDKPYPVLVTDAYIGTITEEKGLIPAKVTIKGEVLVKRFGGFSLLSQVFRELGRTLSKRYADQRVFLASCMLVLYERSSQALYAADWMSEQYRGLKFPLEQPFVGEAERIATGMHSSLESCFGDEAEMVLESAAAVYRVRVNGVWVTSSTAGCDWVVQKYGIHLRGDGDE